MNREDIQGFLDEEGRIRRWPSRHAKKQAVLEHLAARFETGRDYTEKEVNEIIQEGHTFGDYFLLRRELIESQHLMRTRRGDRYWKNEEKNPED